MPQPTHVGRSGQFFEVPLPHVAVPVGAMLWDRPMAAVVAWRCLGALFVQTDLMGVTMFRPNRWRWRTAALIGHRAFLQPRVGPRLRNRGVS